MVLKEKIHQLVDACDDEMILQEIRFHLPKAKDGQDWWLELPDTE